MTLCIYQCICVRVYTRHTVCQKIESLEVTILEKMEVDEYLDPGLGIWLEPKGRDICALGRHQLSPESLLLFVNTHTVLAIPIPSLPYNLPKFSLVWCEGKNGICKFVISF